MHLHLVTGGRDGAEAGGSPRALPPPAAATLAELFAGDGRDGGAVGFALAGFARPEPLLWVQDRLALRETGRPFLHGVGRDFVHVEARDAREALWALEEGLRCPALGGVLGEIWGEPRALDFVATRRLAVAAEKSGVPATLILWAAEPGLSGARRRWRVRSLPSPTHPHDARAPGAPAWELDLFKTRDAAPAAWNVSHEAGGLRLLAPLGDAELVPAAGGRHAA